MTEKNIIVTRGIPRSPSVSGSRGGGYSSFNPGGAGHFGDDHHSGDHSFAYMGEWESRESQIKAAYTNIVQTLSQVTESDLAAVRALAPVSPSDTIGSMSHELAVRDSLIAAKATEVGEQEKIANSFFGSDPSNKTVDDWMRLYNSGRDPVSLLADWTNSFSAAFTAKFIRQEINLLTSQSASLISNLKAAKAAAQAAAQAAAEAAAKAAVQAVAQAVADTAAQVAADAENKRKSAMDLSDAEGRAGLGHVPLTPPNVLIDNHLDEARKQKEYFSEGGSGHLLSWFYKKVRNRGDWDFKQFGSQYEEFGNFNYGATGTAAGISADVLLRAAGAAQALAGTSKKEFGKWWSEPPYGDDPVDQVWIRAGVEYARSKGF